MENHLKFLPILVHSRNGIHIGVHAVCNIIDSKPLDTAEFMRILSGVHEENWADFLEKNDRVHDAIERMKYENEYTALAVFDNEEPNQYYNPAILIVSESYVKGANTEDQKITKSRFIGIDEFSILIKKSHTWIYRKIGTEQIPKPIRIGGTFRWDRNKVLKWLEGKPRVGAYKPRKQRNKIKGVKND
jgi:predicted DNA-binding transcriptional regulator AlpA